MRPRLGLGSAHNQALAWFDEIVFRRALSLKLPFSIKELKTVQCIEYSAEKLC